METPVDHALFTTYPGRLRDILKLEIPFVQIKFVGNQVTRKINIEEAVIVYIAQPDPATVIVIPIFIDIELFGVGYRILETDLGTIAVHQFEQGSIEVVPAVVTADHQ